MYLEIVRRVRAATDEALGRATPDWRLKYGCPPCGYKVILTLRHVIVDLSMFINIFRYATPQQPDEPVLVPARLHAMDGNNSLKRIEASGHADERSFKSAFLIPPEEVDQFQNEVSARKQIAAPPVHPVDADDAADAAECTKRWKAANATAEGSVKVFEQIGYLRVTRQNPFNGTSPSLEGRATAAVARRVGPRRAYRDRARCHGGDRRLDHAPRRTRFSAPPAGRPTG